MKKIFESNIFYSPFFIFKRFKQILERCGENKVFQSSHFQKERELWITALYLMAIGKAQNKFWWASPEETEQTPDTYGVSIGERDKGHVLEIQNIEIVEWEKHSKLTLVEHLRKKIGEKKYPPYFVLLCYVHDHAGESVELDELYNQVVTEKYGIGEIYLLASQLHPTYNHKLARLHPNRFAIDFNFTEELNRIRKQGDMIRTTRGFGKEVTNLGTHEVRYPDCE